jgi:ribosomal protein L37AE/L43A
VPDCGHECLSVAANAQGPIALGVLHVQRSECYELDSAPRCWSLDCEQKANVGLKRRDQGTERKGQVHDLTESITRAHPLRCPFCEVYDLETSGHDSARCSACGGFLGGEFLQSLRQITELPDVMGRHACECGHPEMRRLPDGVFHCPACGSEVTLISTP